MAHRHGSTSMSNGMILQRATRGKRGITIEGWLKIEDCSKIRRENSVVIRSKLNYLTRNNNKMLSLKTLHQDLTPYLRRIFTLSSFLERERIK